MGFKIEKTNSTPFICFEDGVFTIAGRSIPENSTKFFEPVYKAVSDYTLSPFQQTELNLKLEYANSSSNRALINIITLFEKVFESGHNVKINWFYERGDDLMAELGTDVKNLTRIPFNLIEVDFFS